MRDQLIQYVNLLFAANTGAEEIRDEILQNTLDRYDDLIDQGKTPQAAYQLAISGIGDINELLSGTPVPVYSTPIHTEPERNDEQQEFARRMRAIAIGMYIVSLAPTILLDTMFNLSELGFIFTLMIVAAATVILIIYSKKNAEEAPTFSTPQQEDTPRDELKKSIRKCISAVGLAVYLLVSFATGAWFVTWLIFPITAAVQGIINACIDLLKEDSL